MWSNVAQLFVDNVHHIWQTHGIAQDVDKTLTVSLLIVWHYGRTVTLLTPIYDKKRNTAAQPM
jgi:hypothetical protein